MSVDGFRVDLGGTRASSTRIRVRAGHFERVLNVAGGGVRALKFSPALRADTFTITVEPVAGEPAACDAKVTLFGGGDAVAVLDP